MIVVCFGLTICVLTLCRYDVHSKLITRDRFENATIESRQQLSSKLKDPNNHGFNGVTDDAIDEDDLLLALHHFMSQFKFISSAESMTQPNWLNHVCTSECMCCTYKSIVICLHTGCIHHCSLNCEYATETSDDSKICTLSGRRIAHYSTFVDFDEDFENGNNQAYSTMGLKTPAIKGAHNCMRIMNVMKQETTKKRKAEESALNINVEKRHRNAKNVQTIVALPEQECTKHINMAMNVELEQLEIQNIAMSIMKCWNTITTTPLYATNRSKYKPLYHVLACLYEMQNGVIINSIELLPQNQSIQNKILTKNALSQKNASISRKKLTSCTKLLRQFFEQIQ